MDTIIYIHLHKKLRTKEASFGYLFVSLIQYWCFPLYFTSALLHLEQLASWNAQVITLGAISLMKNTSKVLYGFKLPFRLKAINSDKSSWDTPGTFSFNGKLSDLHSPCFIPSPLLMLWSHDSVHKACFKIERGERKLAISKKKKLFQKRNNAWETAIALLKCLAPFVPDCHL